MEFLSFGSVLQEGSSVIIVGVYTDKITVSLVKREKGKIVVTATAGEPQEGEMISHGLLDTERIALNCRKALAALSHAVGNNTPHDVVFALGGSIGEFSFIREKGIREAKEKKISAEELAALVGGREKEKSGAVSRSFAESFHIDGFAVEDPVGLNGGEILAGVARAACPLALAQNLAFAVEGVGASVKGFFDMRYAAAKYADLFKAGGGSAIILCVFEHEISAVLVRDRAVAGIGVVPVGYGILTEAIIKIFSVGREEAKEIMRAHARKELDAQVSERVSDAYRAAYTPLISEITNVAARLDPMSLLPGNVWVVSSEDAPPHIYDAFRSSDWLAALPMERNAAVHTWNTEEQEEFLTPFDHIIAKLL